MGNFRSGFRRSNKKRTVENCLSLRLVSVSRTTIAFYCTDSGFVVWTITQAWKDENVKGIHRLLRSMSIKYATVFNSRWRTETQEIQLQASVPNFNGRRWWFRCRCRRKVGRLYLPPNTRYFACRHCHNLTYTSTQQDDKRARTLKRDPKALKEALDGINKNPSKYILGLKALGVWEQTRTALELDIIPELLAFQRMSPEEHLSAAASLLSKEPTLKTITKAEEHLEAIPFDDALEQSSLPLWRTAQMLRKRLEKRQ